MDANFFLNIKYIQHPKLASLCARHISICGYMNTSHTKSISEEHSTLIRIVPFRHRNSHTVNGMMGLPSLDPTHTTHTDHMFKIRTVTAILNLASKLHRLYLTAQARGLHCLHRVHTVFTLSLHQVYTEFTPCLHVVYTRFTLSLHQVYTEFTPCLHHVYTVFTLSLQPAAEDNSTLLGNYSVKDSVQMIKTRKIPICYA